MYRNLSEQPSFIGTQIHDRNPDRIIHCRLRTLGKSSAHNRSESKLRTPPKQFHGFLGCKILSFQPVQELGRDCVLHRSCETD